MNDFYLMLADYGAGELYPIEWEISKSDGDTVIELISRQEHEHLAKVLYGFRDVTAVFCLAALKILLIRDGTDAEISDLIKKHVPDWRDYLAAEVAAANSQPNERVTKDMVI